MIERDSRFALTIAGAVAAGMALPCVGAPAPTDDEVFHAFSVSAYSLQEPVVDVTSPQHAFVEVELDGDLVKLSLLRTTVRSPDFTMLVQDDAGLREVAPPPIRTFTGTIPAAPESRVSATLDGERVNAMIRHEGRVWVVQPLTDAFADAPAGLHVVYDSADLVPGPWHCGLAGAADGDAGQGHGAIPEAPASGSLKVAELAFDADFEYFTDFDSDEGAVVTQIEELVNDMNQIYQLEVGASHIITTIIVRTTDADPYTTADPESLLLEVEDEWVNNLSDIQRDLAHLWTGRNLVGFTVGIANLGGICSFFAQYGLSENFSASTLQLVGLMSHEIGHNWGAFHCDEQSPDCLPDCAIMCSGLGGCGGNGIDNFGACATQSITGTANQAGCLDTGGGNGAWQIDVTTDDGDTLVEAGETATVTLSLDYIPNVDGENVQGLSAMIFDTLGVLGADTGEIVSWEVLNELAFLTGDLTTSDGTSLFGTNAGQLTQFGPFTADDPIAVLQLDWQPDVLEGQTVLYQTSTSVLQVWEGDFADPSSIPWNPIDNAVLINVAEAGACVADCNGDGLLNILDFTCFQALFASGDSGADCNGDGSLNILDFTCFQAAFAAGCP